MTCKDCFHFDICNGWSGIPPDKSSDLCGHFADKPNWRYIPLKINQIVYAIDKYKWSRELNAYTEFKVVPYQIRSIAMSCDSKGIWKTSFRVQEYRDGKTVDRGFNFHVCEIGEEVFLTKEEAEKALAESDISKIL